MFLPRLRSLFNLLCFAVTFSMLGVWCYKFIQDEDLCLVDYKKMDDSSDVNIFPDLSMCLVDPFLEDKLREFQPQLDATTYRDFLRGDVFHKEMTNMDYESVTKKLENYFIEYAIMWKNGTISSYQPPNSSLFNNSLIGVSYRHIISTNSLFQKVPQETFTGFAHLYFLKCVGLEINPKYTSDIIAVRMVYKQTLFPNSTRPEKCGFSVFFHLKQQSRLSMQTFKYNWPFRNRKTNYRMAFKIKSFELLQRRNKRTQPCIKDWKHYDTLLSNHQIEEAGCRTPYQTKAVNKSICTSSKQMKMAQISVSNKLPTDFPPPCLEMSIIDYNFEEFDHGGNGEWFYISIFPTDRYRLIKQSEVIDIHSLIGNSGGYIGLFLGM